VVVDRYVDIFSAIDEEFSEALRVANRKGVREEGWDADQMIAHAETMVGEWLLLQSLTEKFGAVIDSAAVSRMTEAAGSVEALMTGMEVFDTAFADSSQALTTFKDSLSTQFSELNLTLPSSRDAFTDLVNSIDLTTESGQALYAELIAMAPALDEFYAAMQPFEELMSEIDDELASLTLTPFEQELRSISTWLSETTREAQSYGASQADLARIQQVAALRTKEAIESLRSSISSLTEELYGTADSNRLAQVQAGITAETSNLAARQTAANELYNAEMARYNSSLSAITQINTYVSKLGSNTKTMQAAGETYRAALSAARQGDVSAIAEITTHARDFISAVAAHEAEQNALAASAIQDRITEEQARLDTIQ